MTNPDYTNFKKINDDLQTMASLHKQIGSYGLGDTDQLSFWTQVRDKQENTTFEPPIFPLLYVVPSTCENNLRYKTWELNLVMMDIVDRDLANQVDVLSDTLQMLQDVVSQYRLSVTNQFGLYDAYYDAVDNVEFIPFLEDYTDLCNGWNAVLRFTTTTALDRCAAAFNPFTGTPIIHDTINFKTFHDDFRLLADYHKQLNSFGFGQHEDLSYWTESRLKQQNTTFESPFFPLLYVVPGNAIQKMEQNGSSFTEYEFNLICMDIIDRDLTNQADVLSDTNQILDDVISQFRLSVTNSLGNFNAKYYVDDSVVYYPFLEKYSDLCGGWNAVMRVKVMTPLDRCAAPFNSFLTPTPTLTPSNTPTPSVTSTNTPTPSITASQTPSVTPTNTPSVTQTSTPTSTSTNTPSVTQTSTPSSTATPTNTPSNTQTSTPSSTATPTNTATNTPTSTQTSTPTPSITSSQTPSTTPTQTPSITPSATPIPINPCIWNENSTNWNDETTLWNVCPSPVITPTATPTNTATPSNTPSVTTTSTPTPSITSSPSPSVTQTNTPTNTETPTNTPSVTMTATPTNTETPTNTPSVTETSTPTNTPTNTETPTNTPSVTMTATPTNTPTPSITASPTNTPTNTPSVTQTQTPSPTPPFNPLTLNPMIWLDFNDVSTLSLRSGQYVQSVTNKGNWTSFTGFSQTTAANQPSWSASTMGTGMSAITISNDFLQASQNLTGSSWNTIAVMKYAGTNPFGLITINGSSGRGWSNLYPERNNSRYADYIIYPGGFEYRANFTGFTGFNTTHVAQGYMSNSSTTIVSNVSVNNSGLTRTITSNNAVATGYPGAILSPVFRIINVDELQTPVSGEIGEIYLFDKELTSTQQTNLINYLKTKWGIT